MSDNLVSNLSCGYLAREIAPLPGQKPEQLIYDAGARDVEKHLPQNIEAECGVLGSIIIDPEAIVQVADFLHAEDFYRDAHRTIFEVIVQLYDQREAADFITICDELTRRNKLEQVGGAGYITSLINQVPTSGNIEHYGH